MIHEMACLEPWFSKILNEEKPVEGRKGKPEYRKIKAGDKIRFLDDDKSFIALVTKVDEFDSVTDYLKGVGLENALPDPHVKTIEDGLKIYYQWSTSEQIEKLGFLGIWVQPEKTTG